MTGWQWHQLDHMQIICTSLQPDNHASTSSLSFLKAKPTVSSWMWKRLTDLAVPSVMIGHIHVVLWCDLIIIIIIISARQLLSDLGRKISESTGEAREASFLFQRCSALVQHFNVILLHDSLPAYDCTDWMFVPIFVFSLIIKLPRDYPYWGLK